jgi:TPR repeat protein
LGNGVERNEKLAAEWFTKAANQGISDAQYNFGVFFCGPKVLSQELAKQCKIHTDTRSNTKFVFKKENF